MKIAFDQTMLVLSEKELSNFVVAVGILRALLSFPDPTTHRNLSLNPEICLSSGPHLSGLSCKIFQREKTRISDPTNKHSRNKVRHTHLLSPLRNFFNPLPTRRMSRQEINVVPSIERLHPLPKRRCCPRIEACPICQFQSNIVRCRTKKKKRNKFRWWL